jgi:hypothetical protein
MLYIEFRDNYRKASEYKITKLPNGYTKYVKKDDIFLDKVDCLMIHREGRPAIGPFRIEIHSKLTEIGSWKKELKALYTFFSKIPETDAKRLCDENGGGYFTFTIGKNYHDVNDSKETKKYTGWYYLQFDNGFENLFCIPRVRKAVGKNDILQETSKADWAQTHIFLGRTLTSKGIERAFKKYAQFCEQAIQLGMKLNEIYSSFGEAFSWKAIK